MLRKQGGSIKRREPSAFIDYISDSKNNAPIKNIKEERGIEPLNDTDLSLLVMSDMSTRRIGSSIKERVSGHLAIQQYTKAHSGYSPSLLH